MLNIQIILSNFALLIGWFLVLLGLFFTLTGAVGMLRFDGFFNKIHASGVSDSCGIIILLVGFAILQVSFTFALKFLLLALFLLISGPFSTHALAKAAMIQKIEPDLFEKAKQHE
jgi:multicomponent Na+:H+ antiporter subunit G